MKTNLDCEKEINEFNQEIQQNNLERIDAGNKQCWNCGGDLGKDGFITRDSINAGYGCGCCEGI